MRRHRFIRRATMNQRGMTLVEILVAVTIMSIISISVMSYFVAGMEKSTDDSRKVIAANLARSKLSELRSVFQGANYAALSGYFTPANSMNPLIMKNNADIPIQLEPFLKDRLTWKTINNTTYRFLIEMDNRSSLSQGGATRKKDMMDSYSFFSDPENYLLKLTITVYWSSQESSTPSRKNSTTLDSYLVNRR